jgi:hypothetical protein
MWPWIRRSEHKEIVAILTENAKLGAHLQERHIEGLEKQIEELTAERKRLTDWIARGYSGQSIYADPPKIQVADEPEREPDLANDQVLSPAEEAIRKYGVKGRTVQRAIQAHDDAAAREVFAALEKAEAEGRAMARAKG